MSWTSAGEGEEDVSDYVKGGYHPVFVGERFSNGRYVVVRKLGWGQFSTVWLCRDLRNECKVALKVVKSASRYTESALDELKLLKALDFPAAASPHPGRSNIIALLDNFHHHGPHGTHVCMVFEPAGDNLLDMIRQYRSSHRTNYIGVPVQVVREISKQVLLGLDYMHRVCGLIHTDIKPENILFSFQSVDYHHDRIHVKIADLGNATWVNHRFTDFIQTRQYRSPEVIVGAKWDTSADIWSWACVAFELLALTYLFCPESAPGYPREEDHLAQILELCSSGLVPRCLLNGAESSEYFTRYGELRHIPPPTLRPHSLSNVLYHKYRFPRIDAESISSFLLPMLEVDPKRRAPAAQMLQHPFVANLLSRRERDAIEGRFYGPNSNRTASRTTSSIHSWRR